jgi:Flp pilus assembly protein CpaB
MDNMVGAVVREPIAANEPIVERKIVRGGEGGYLVMSDGATVNVSRSRKDALMKLF